MAGLTRQNVIDTAKALCNVTLNNFWDATTQNTMADRANEMVYRLLVDANPEWFQRVNNGSAATFSWTAGTEGLDMTAAGVLGAEPYRVLGVEDVPTAAAVSQTNFPRRWTRIAFHERARLLQTWGDQGHHYWIHGLKLGAAPVPSTALNVIVYWVPKVGALSASSTEVLDGLAEPFGDAVAYALAHLLNVKQGGSNRAVDALWDEAKARINGEASRRVQDGPRMVSYQGLGPGRRRTLGWGGW